jgi:hypothetical protein
VELSFDPGMPVDPFVKLSVQSNDGPEPVDITLNVQTGPGQIFADAFPLDAPLESRTYMDTLFPECEARVPVSLWGSGG